MSLRNRARALQKKTGLTYQQALQRVRAFGERSAKLRRETGWPLDVCDRFLVDGRAPVTVIEADRIDAPSEVMEAHRSALITATLDEIGLVCESLRTTAAARTVLLVDLRGCVIAHVDRGRYRIVPGTPLMQISFWRDALEKSRSLSSDSWELDDRIVLVKVSVKTRSRSRYARIAAARALLIVVFHRDESSLGLVRLRMAKALKELAPLLTDDETPTMPPFGSGGGPSGTPSEMRVAEPVPEERPKKKPTPIGRKRKHRR
jgi:hypothetical protein